MHHNVQTDHWLVVNSYGGGEEHVVNDQVNYQKLFFEYLHC